MALKNAFGDITTDNTVILLRRIVKLLETSNMADSAGRQRITIDSQSVALNIAGTLTAVSNITANAGLDQRQFHDTARIAYNTGIRRNLTFS